MTMAMEELKDHLARQDRHVRAAQAMKTSMRESIRSLQEKVKQLEGGEGSEPVKKLQEENVQLGQENLRLKAKIAALEDRVPWFGHTEKDTVMTELRTRVTKLEDEV